VILRGGDNGPNYDHVNIAKISKKLKAKNIKTKVLIDCSHGNSGKDYRNQPAVLETVLSLIENGEENICGFMIESHIQEGSQKHNIANGKKDLEYGKSITDSCVNLQTSFLML